MKNAFIVSHTHWDREWYLTFEQFRYLLVRTMDDLLEEMQNNDFKHFHLDGQTIILDDYLALRPEKKEQITKLVKSGRLAIGPHYILQDEFLTSGEANIRNLLKGVRSAEKYGANCNIGYLPDTFGHFSQMPQILNGFDIDSAVLCRGLISSYEAFRISCERSPNNVIWKGADGSEVLAVFGADWYNNANEINTDTPEISIKNAVNNLGEGKNFLLFNGCDHQPIQKNLDIIIKKAQRCLKDEINVIHSSFQDYINAVRKQNSNLPIASGELTSALGDGMFSFIHTASVRSYLKIKNNHCQNLLEGYAEPIGVFADIEGKTYDKAYYNFAWQTLMQNHPHDSICGCSVDKVHSEMVTRFSKVEDISYSLINDNAKYIVSKIDTSGHDGKAVTVFNTEYYEHSPYVETFVDFEEDANIIPDNVIVVDSEGKIMSHGVRNISRCFSFDNPRDSFRVCRYVKRVSFIFHAEKLPPFGYKTYFVHIDSNKKRVEADKDSLTFCNEFYSLEFNLDGSFNLKIVDGKQYLNLNTYEDSGDIGDEYTFISPELDKIVTTKNKNANVKVVEENEAVRTYEVKHILNTPQGFELIDSNNEKVIKYDGSVGFSSKKHSKRSSQALPNEIYAYVTLYKNSRRIDIKTIVDNKTENHRLRATFPFGLKTEKCFVHTPFDIVERNFDYRPNWGLSDSSDRMQAFCYLADKSDMFLLASRGLNEYEITNKEVLKLTLFRSIDELGDWGYFATPKAQMKGVFEFEYSIIVGAKDIKQELIQQGLLFNKGNNISLQHAHKNAPSLPLSKSYFNVQGKGIILSALKQAEDNEDYIMRFYNPDTVAKSFKIKNGAETVKLDETVIAGKEAPNSLDAKKILTLKIKKSNN